MLKHQISLRACAIGCKIEILDSQDPSAQLTASKLSIKDLFEDLLNEIKGSKYQITVRLIKPIQRKHRQGIYYCLF